MNEVPTTVYVVNLDRSRDRMKKVTRQCQLAGLDLVRFPAVDGSRLTRSERSLGTTVGCNKRCTNGIVGCGMSHMALWQLIVDNDMEDTFVAEDDVVFVRDFKRLLTKYWEEIPVDYDIIYVGCLVGCDPDGLESRDMKMHKWDNHGKKGKRVSEHVFVPNLALGTHCYIISKTGAAKLLEFSNGKVDTHIDHQIQRYAESLNIYGITPTLAFQEQSQSSSTIARNGFPRFLMQPLDHVYVSEHATLAYRLSISPTTIAGQEVNSLIAFFLVIGIIAAYFNLEIAKITGIFSILLLPDLFLNGQILHTSIALIMLIAPSVCINSLFFKKGV